jgi:hypothetical protein
MCSYQLVGVGASKYADNSMRDDWAEAVTASIFQNHENYTDGNGELRMDDDRKDYVEGQRKP